MIWNSVFVMTFIDLVIIGITGLAFVVFYKNRGIVRSARIYSGLGFVIFGLSVTAIFYLFDLFTMYVLPFLIPRADAMKVMTDLHLNYSWIASLLIVGTIVAGFTSLAQRMSSIMGKLAAKERGLSEELDRRRQSESALRDSEERYRFLYQETPAMLHSIDGNGYLTNVNEHWVKTLAYERDEVIGRRATDFLTETSRRYATDVVLPRFFETGEVRDVPYEFVAKDGRILDILLTAFAERDANGRIVGSRSVLIDVTERKAAETALRESEERLRQATELAGLGYYIWDAVEDRCIFCSEQNARIHGTTVEDYISRSSPLEGAFVFTHADDRERVRTTFQALRAGKGFELEYRVITPSGETRYVREIAKPMFDESGSVIREHGTIQDITEFKKAEDQLHQAQKMEAVGQLTGGVAHDFNNLLAVIMGNAEVLRSQLGDRDNTTWAIMRAASRGAELTQRLLAFSRRQPLHPQVVDLKELVAGMSDLLHRTLGETIDVRVSSAPGLWRAFADPGQLENALLNLAINARDAMPSGGTLTIETANTDLKAGGPAAPGDLRPGSYAMLAVSDTGKGMTPEVLEHAFEPFFTTKDVGEGSGLGLSMVYGLVKQTGGHVTVHSEEGRGTRMTLYLPRSQQSEKPVVHETAKEEPEAQGETVMVVEDDPDVRELAVIMLQDLGYIVRQARDSGSALKMLENLSPFDLLLCDMVLPGGMGGPDLAEEIKRRHPATKVLFMSGYARTNIRRDRPILRDAEYLQKPFRRYELAQKLRAALFESSGADGPIIPIETYRRSRSH